MIPIYSHEYLIAGAPDSEVLVAMCLRHLSIGLGISGEAYTVLVKQKHKFTETNLAGGKSSFLIGKLTIYGHLP